ncbi:MAG: TRZ/ATZ family hydrolase [Betaproteobacteria bacterium]|jgi:5-methylthioadenosine/S-adenosylhomocysteine deaminase
MTPVDTLIHARWLIPVRPRATVLEGHAVAITDGKIVAVLPSAQADAAYAPAQRIELPTHALTPGWVNTHTHAAMTLLRGVGDDLPLMQWLETRIWPLETALVDEQFVYDGSQLAALEMLRAGTTTCSDMYFYPDVAARALRSLGMRAVVGIIAIEMPTGYANDAADYLRKGLAARDALRDDPLVHFTLAPHAPYTVADDTLAHIATLAEELDLQVHIHVHETQHEIDESVAQHGQRPLARLDRLGLVSERLIAVHAVHLTDTEIALLAERGATVVHCPASNLKLASGMAPVARLLQAGVKVAFGTDGAASNNRLDLIEETRLAALLAKGASGDAAALPAWQALECATLNGAAALGLEARIGSIEPGKEADLAAFDFAAAETTPCFDPVSHLIYAASRERVSDVWVAGRHVVRGRQTTVEGGPAVAGAVVERAAAWQNHARRCFEAGL